MLSNADLDRLKKKEKVSKEQEQIQNDMYHGPAAGTQVPT
jgi:hypothetical protein